MTGHINIRISEYQKQVSIQGIYLLFFVKQLKKTPKIPIIIYWYLGYFNLKQSNNVSSECNVSDFYSNFQ